MGDPVNLEAFNVAADRRISSIVEGDASYRAKWLRKQFEAHPDRYRITTIRVEDRQDGTGDRDKPMIGRAGAFDMDAFDRSFDPFFAMVGPHTDLIVGGNEVGFGPRTGEVDPKYDDAWFEQTQYMHHQASERKPGIGLAYCSIPNFASFADMLNPRNTNRLATHTRRVILETKVAASRCGWRSYFLCFNLGQTGNLEAAFSALAACLAGTNIGVVFTEFRYPTDASGQDTSAVDEFWELANLTTWNDALGARRTALAACYGPDIPTANLSPAYSAKALVAGGKRTVWGDWFAQICADYNHATHRA